MTRAEQAAEKVRKAREKRAEAQRRADEKDAELAGLERQAEAVKRLEDKKALSRRRHAVGDLAERRGLFVWDNAVLDELFALLATLAPCPNPVAMLAGLLGGIPECLTEALLTAPDFSPSEIYTDQREKSHSPFLETSDESECLHEAKRKGPAAAKVLA